MLTPDLIRRGRGKRVRPLTPTIMPCTLTHFDNPPYPRYDGLDSP